MQKTTIFNIQKFSIHDGPGIRTVVFFKGCPLRCRWCSNPESQKTKRQVLRDYKKCIGCGKCFQICPANAISEHLRIDLSSCTVCGECVGACPVSALSVEGEEKTVDEVVQEVLKDEAFYRTSGGGVTYSGGEPILQIDFIEELSAALRRHGISIASETTGFASADVFERFLDCVDLLLFDLKHTDSDVHRKGTGVDNACILENLRRAAEAEKEIVIRIPIIPGFNDSIAQAKDFCNVICQMGLKKVNLLPFHQFGENKYASLNMEYSMKGVAPLHPEDLQEILSVFQTCGLDAQIGG